MVMSIFSVAIAIAHADRIETSGGDYIAQAYRIPTFSGGCLPSAWCEDMGDLLPS